MNKTEVIEVNLPEPQEDENLLIEDVQCQHAERIVFLDRSRSTEFVECTLRYSWEYFNLKNYDMKIRYLFWT